MKLHELPGSVLQRRALVYVRQSSGQQVQENLESQRRQYELADLAKAYGFSDIEIIDDDLGSSAGGMVDRPGFNRLVAQLCGGSVGAIFCLEASRLARNGREWHHLLELCGMVGARVIDGEGVHDPGIPNDRLVLGLKGTMSEFELTTMRKRLVEAAQAKAARGELRVPVPIGFIWKQDTGLELDPDLRIQDAIHSVFRLFERLGSARQVLLYMCKDGVPFPRPASRSSHEELEWRSPAYRNIISVLRNPFYAGAYAYGKSETRTQLVDGRLRKSYGHSRPMRDWTVLIWDHHEGYITREHFEQIRDKLQRNTFSQPAGSAKSGRGGKALLSGVLRCRRCGRMLSVAYSGRALIRYACRQGHTMHGTAPCISFGAARPEAAFVAKLAEVLQPVAVEAALMASELADEAEDARHRGLELELQQAKYTAQLAKRRYESVDPDNRLVASELEARWNAALAGVRECETRIADLRSSPAPTVSREDLVDLATDLRAIWNAPGTDMRTKQRLARTLIEEIIVDVDDDTREVILVVHWKGGQHSELRVTKPATGEHSRRTPADVEAIIRDMAGNWTDDHIAATLNRMGTRTGQGMTWTGERVRSVRSRCKIHGYASRGDGGAMLTMSEAATKLDVTHYFIRKLIQQGILPAKQTIKDAPWQIQADDLDAEPVQHALAKRRDRGTPPCRRSSDTRALMIPGTCEGDAQ
ncbi:MAG: recombinase family protein [Actinomycetales bacterium]|nr:recombinase family protein [Actinomycetales bacterium]